MDEGKEVELFIDKAYTLLMMQMIQYKDCYLAVVPELVRWCVLKNAKQLYLHWTNQCNLCCPHCYMASGVAYDNELSTEEIKELCADFRNVGGTHVFLISLNSK